MNKFFITVLVFSVARLCESQEPQDESPNGGEFAPAVTASCRAGLMTINVVTSSPFFGTVHSRELRTPPCIIDGKGSNVTTVVYNMLASSSDPDYCGVITNRNEERSVQIAVRAHHTLELASDKLYVVTCGRTSSRNRNSQVKLSFLDGESRGTNEVFYGRAYTLKLELTKGSEAIRVRNCFSFGSSNNSVPLVNEAGCPERGVISSWSYSANNRIATATIYSMFRFQDSKKLNFQCEVVLCQEENCPNPVCESMPLINPARQTTNEPNENVILAASTVSVLDPGDKPEARTDGCTGICPKWLLWLAIVLGVLFLLMLLVNLFLCSALTCTCTRTELVEKEPSVLEDYDPYRSWAGSQYGGSRYSLNGHKPLYSVSAESNGSDHYATVPSRHSRPGSRYSNNGVNGPNRPSSNSNSPYTHNRKL